MPSPFPEGNVVQSQDNEWRTWFKIASRLYASVGNQGGPWPEGTVPLVGDNEERLEEKCNKMLE